MLLAVDGATSSISAQVRRTPDDVTYTIASIAGNDALGNIDILSAPVAIHSRDAGTTLN